ncbi:MAG: BatA domain-containing protein [Salinirussus sp.]
MVFLTPLGLLALLSVVPLLIAYLVRPEPVRVRLPTMDFLASGEEGGTDRSAFERLRRDLLLLVQLFVLVAVALALASPFVTVTGTAQVAESVVVLDTSASMSVEDAGGQSRFDRAKEIASEQFSSTSSLVTAGTQPRVPVRRGAASDARAALSEVTRTGSQGDLPGAVSRAVAVADRSARIVVVSDFAGDSPWRSAVETARNRGYTVELRPVGGRLDNVGIVDADYGRSTVTVSVRNYADSEVTRTVSLGDAERSLTLRPGDVGTATLPVPPSNAELRLRPGDGFPIDDRLFVAGPDSSQVRVLLITSGESEFVRTALSVLPEVELTVRRPPTTVDGSYDAVVFSEVNRDRLLDSTRQRVETLVREGGGVVITAQPDLGEVPYGPLNPVSVTGSDRNPSVKRGESPLVRGIRFTPPTEYLTARLDNGSRALVLAGDSPLLARGSLGAGRTFYYGYIESRSTFQFNYQYPVLWKRLIYEAAGRETLERTNLPAGTSLSVANGTTVVTPDGETTANGSVRLDRTGFYRVGDRRYGVSLVSAVESNVSAPQFDPGTDSIVRERDRTVQKPLDLSPVAAGLAAVAVIGELALLGRRGDL